MNPSDGALRGFRLETLGWREVVLLPTLTQQRNTMPATNVLSWLTDGIN
jgi:hypothetical protein